MEIGEKSSDQDSFSLENIALTTAMGLLISSMVTAALEGFQIFGTKNDTARIFENISVYEFTLGSIAFIFAITELISEKISTALHKL